MGTDATTSTQHHFAGQNTSFNRPRPDQTDASAPLTGKQLDAARALVQQAKAALKKARRAMKALKKAHKERRKDAR